MDNHCNTCHRSRPWIALGALLLLSAACSPSVPEVIVYTSVDQVYAEPILDEAERRTGLRIRPVFDVEANKTTGLVQRLIAEADHPRADVFWNGEFANTLLLAERGLLAPHSPITAADVPAAMRSPDALWTAVGCRARVFLVNTDHLDPATLPTSLTALLNSGRDLSRFAFANPLFGTTATHAAALFSTIGPNSIGLFSALIDNGARMVDGNSVVRDLVVNGQIDFGLTDTDDACRAVANGDPVALVMLDEGATGAVLIPGTVALLLNGPNPSNARILVDYLVSRETERQLIESGASQLSVRPDGERSQCLPDTAVTGTDLDLEVIFNALEPSRRALRDVVLK